MKKTLVSILIPAYNAERWITETLESAISQTWQKKEIIVVDDGSSDKTFSIAKKHESVILKVIRQENQGASTARNLALSHAQGDYIQWLDADDLLAQNKISRQLLELEKGYGARTLISGSFAIFYARLKKAKFVPNSLWKDLSPVDWLINKFQNNIWMSPAVWLVSKDLTDRAGSWDERLSLDDDGEYFSRIVAESEHIHFVPEAKAYYRQWQTGSLSRIRSEKAIKSLYLSLTLCINYLLDLEDSQRTRDACILYLQKRSDYFYPDHADLFDKIRKIALDLGRDIIIPKQKNKYIVIEKLFGSYTTKNLISIARKTKFLAAYHLDDIFLKIQHIRGGINKSDA